MNLNLNNLKTLAFIILLIVMTGCTVDKTVYREHIATVSSADGSAITYGIRGQGDVTVVFVHCWTCNHEFWRPQIDYFSEQHQVIWLDLAGHGLSGSKRQEYNMTAFGADVAAVVNKAASNKVILVGHSMGGPVSIEAAKLLGDKVLAIVGVDTFYTPFEYPQSEQKIDEFVKPFKDDFTAASDRMVRSMFTPQADPELIESIVSQISVADREMAISAMNEIFRWSASNNPSALDRYADKLRNINGAPTGKETARHKSVLMIPGVGHFVAQAKADEFNKALDKIISEFQRN